MGAKKKSESQNYYQKSLKMFEEIAKNDPSMVNNENLAMAYNDIANLYSTGDRQDIVNAKFYYKKAIAIIKNFWMSMRI